jgi:probable rRNA maturation factor
MLEIALEAEDEWDSSRSWEKLVRSAVEAAIQESAFPDLAECERPVEISVKFTGNDEVQSLNAMWRGKDCATNVLSFPLADAADLKSRNQHGPELLLGDIVLARGVCAAEAAEKGVRVEDHATHLVIHGTLHLLGYDHQREAEASDMEAREVRALERLGIRNPYEVPA